MGTKFAPVYATLVIAYLEEAMYSQSETEIDSDFKHIKKAILKDI